MRYFLTTNVSRSFSANGFSFSDFEPVGQRGGSWFGVLAVADEAAASALAASIASGENIGVDEISAEVYDIQKKKGSSNSPTLSESGQNRSPAQVLSAAPAASHGYPSVSNSTEMITPVTLLTGEATPPHESLLEQPAIRRKRGGQ